MGKLNEFAHILLAEFIHLVVKTHGRQDGSRQHYNVLPGSYTKCTQTSKIEKKMLTSSLNWQPDHCTPHRKAFKAIVNTKAVLSLGFAKSLW